MRLLWLTWKDMDNPDAGGAERVNEAIAEGLVKRGWEVKFVVAGYAGGSNESARSGFTIERVGRRYSLYFKAWRLYKKELSDWPDVIIDECNTLPFFARWYSRQPVVMLYYQLARKVWFYQMLPGLSIIGYLAESVYLRLLNKSIVLTESSSTRDDLLRFGYEARNITVFPISLQPFPKVQDERKYKQPTVIMLGGIRPMKRPVMAMKAFEIAHRDNPKLRLLVVGRCEGIYGRYFKWRVARSGANAAISILGALDEQDKLVALRRSWVHVSASLKEGWGLTVTEAAAQETISVGTSSDGLRDSLEAHNGIMTKANAKALAAGLTRAITAKPKPVFPDAHRSYNSAVVIFEKTLGDIL